MPRLSELLRRPVVSEDAGARVGEVADLLVDGGRVVGIVLAGGIIASEHVLPFSDVRLFGEDTVIASSATALVNAKQWNKSGLKGERLTSFKRKQIVTTSGQALGVVGDVYVGGDGEVIGYDVETRGFAGLVKRRQMLPAHGVTAGRDALVVSDAAASSFAVKDQR
jgi:uncharacterized protein YrrD